MSDEILRFIFDGTDIRGEWVQLERSYLDTLATHHYPPLVNQLLGEFLVAASLLAATLKIDGTVILQARGPAGGLIMAEATSRQELRAIASGLGEIPATSFEALLGGGNLAITIDPDKGQRYQGIVALEGANLAECLEGYFRQSEQLPTRVWLAADGQHAGGLFLQELPTRTDPARRSEQWQHLTTLAATVTAAELLQLPAETLLHRLFHQEQLRLLQRDPLQFHCSCSQQRTEAMLLSLGRSDLEEILAEQGRIDVNCEFCNQHYGFAPEDIATLLGAAAEPPRH